MSLINAGTPRSDGGLELPKPPLTIKATGCLAVALVAVAIISFVCLTTATAIVNQDLSPCGAHLDAFIDASNRCRPVGVEKAQKLSDSFSMIHHVLLPLWIAPIFALAVGAIGIFSMAKLNGTAPIGSACCNSILAPVVGILGGVALTSAIVVKVGCVAAGYSKGASDEHCAKHFLVLLETAQGPSNRCPALADIPRKEYVAEELFCSMAGETSESCWCQCQDEFSRLCDATLNATTVTAICLLIITVLSCIGLASNCVFCCSRGARENVDAAKRAKKLTEMAKHQSAMRAP